MTWRLSHRSFYHMRRIIETNPLGASIQEWVWRTKFSFRRQEWLGTFDKAVEHPHREILAEKISSYSPLESILEVGCNRGQNLVLLTKRFPMTRLHGIDINAIAIQEGKRQLKQREIDNVFLATGKASDLRRFPDKSMDVALTDSLCIYIAPDKIERLIQELARIARKTVILSEWHFQSSLKPYLYDEGAWIYDYRILLNQPSFSSLRITRYPEGIWNDKRWGKFGAIIEAECR